MAAGMLNTADGGLFLQNPESDVCNLVEYWHNAISRSLVRKEEEG